MFPSFPPWSELVRPASPPARKGRNWRLIALNATNLNHGQGFAGGVKCAQDNPWQPPWICLIFEDVRIVRLDDRNASTNI